MIFAVVSEISEALTPVTFAGAVMPSTTSLSLLLTSPHSAMPLKEYLVEGLRPVNL